MKKLVSLVLVLILACTLLPVSAAAAFDPTDYIEFQQQKDGWLGFNPSAGKWQSVPKDVFSSEYQQIIRVGDQWKAYKKDSSTLVNITEDMAALIQKLKGPEPIVHGPNDHKYSYASNTKYHWLECACGCKISMEHHVDPLDTTDDYCTCGYHFSDDAGLVTLWLQDCKGLNNFRKDVFAYETDAFTYKPVNEIKRIATRTHDSEATVELPEDLTLKEGENKIEVKVIAENKKVTQVYTVIVNKEAAK